MVMWGHLSEPKLLDVAEGAGDPDERRHAGDCAACRVRVLELREGLARAREADVPEPSPLYWDSFRREVGRRIEAETAEGPARWSGVAALVALAACVALAFGLMRSMPSAAPTPSLAATLPAWSPPTPDGDDVGLSVIEALAPSPSAEDVSPLTACAVEDCLAELSDEESRAVAESLKQELSGRTL
jgi:hypothetical protein